MRIKSLRLRNFCQYRDFLYEYLPGISGIVGHNGSGKSNFLDAGQYFAVTGLAPKGKNKSELLRWGSDTGYTCLTFTDDNREYTLTRNIHNASAELTWEEEEVTHRISKQGEVNTKMEELLGMSFEVFRESCFVPQGKFLDVIEAPHSERMEYFAKICGTAKAESIRGMLQGKLSKLPVVADRKEEMRVMQADIHKEEEHLELLKAILLQYEQEVAALEEDNREAAGKLSIRTESEYRSDVSAAEAALSRAEKALEEFRKDNSLEEVIEVHPLTEQDNLAYAAYKALPSLREELTRKNNEYLSCVSSKEPEPVKIKAQGVELVESEQRWINENAARYRMALDKVCPTCKREYTFEKDPAEFIQEYKYRNAELDILKTAWKETEAKYNRWERSEAVRAGREAALEQSLKEAIASVHITEEMLQEFCYEEYAEHAVRYKAYTDYIRKRESMSKAHRDKEVAVKVCRDKLETVKATPFRTDAERETDRQIMKAYSDKNNTCRNTRSEIQSANRVLDNFRNQMAAMETRQKEADKVNRIAARLEFCRDILHRDNLPKMVMRRMLVALNSRLNYFMEQFRTDFSAALNEEFDFVCDFPGGHFGKSAKNLSGGQKVALALAFRLALSDVLGASVPLLVMDEPTVFLDDANVESVREVLDSAKSYMEKGSFVMIATHAPELRSAFTQVVNVQERDEG